METPYFEGKVNCPVNAVMQTKTRHALPELLEKTKFIFFILQHIRKVYNIF